MAKSEIRKFTVIHPSGRVETYNAPNDLGSKQKAVGGCIEPLPYFVRYDGRYCEAYVNENGIAEGLPVNYSGTMAWRKAIAKKFTDTSWAGCFGPVVIIQKLA